MRSSNVMSSVALALAFSASASAGPILDDSLNSSVAYWGAAANGYEDVVGEPAKFDIQSARAFYNTAHELVVEITTNFVDHMGVYPGLTVGSKGIGFGDLFLSTGAYLPNWTATTPNDANGNHRLQDNAATGNHWTYGFSLDDRWTTPSVSSKGVGTLYSLPAADSDNNPGALLSNAFISSGIYRKGQEVAVNASHSQVKVEQSGNWYVDKNVISFIMNVQGTALAHDASTPSPTLALHWGMTCANDVIEGVLPYDPPRQRVPEPATLALLGLGLAGIGFARRSRARR